MPTGMDGQWQLLRAAAMTNSKYVRPPESDATVRNRMREGVLKGTHDRLHGDEANIFAPGCRCCAWCRICPTAPAKAPDHLLRDPAN